MVELWRWVMVASKRLDAIPADHTVSNRGATGRRRLAERGCR
jgi:hypothetical protein